jgi:tetratricopeptide (TPR) repeat protein
MGVISRGQILSLFVALALPLTAVSGEPPEKTAETRPVFGSTEIATANAARRIVVDPKARARRKTAVALNYCRASFHRIRRTSSRAVLYEEQARILNNLDLNGIADEAVIKLYSSLLNEINQVEIAHRERVMIEKSHRQGLHRKFGTELFVIGAEVATGQVGNAVRSGANSWWDYRSKESKRTESIWKIERANLQSLVNHSSEFLNAFWKLSRTNDIPDNWLVRETDLDRMDLAVREPDPEVRLRVLKRMSRFMECYPPYHYHVARTQQQLGDFSAAAKTYERLSDLGDGFFRNDDMMAASLANLAMIQHEQNHPQAVRTAQAALQKSTRVWEANVASAWVLGQHKQYTEAEDALLRNLDVDLETTYSTLSLVSLYYHSSDKPKLAKMIGRPDVARLIPVPGLLMCAGLLGSEMMPENATAQLAQSMYGFVNLRLGHDDFSIVASPGWQLVNADMTLYIGDRELTSPRVNSNGQRIEARFVNIGELRQPNSERAGRPIELALKWENTPEVRLELNVGTLANPAFRSPKFVAQFGIAPKRDSRFRLSSVEIGNVRLSMDASDQRG